MIFTVFQIVLYLAVPLVAIELARRYRVFEWFNPVVLCYVVGMVMVNTPLWEIDEGLARTVTEASIPLAIPLILFSSDIRAWLSQSRPTVVSFICALIAVCTVSYLTALGMGHTVDDPATTAGMLVGVYSGGTPNLMSIGMALEATEELFVLLNASDVIVGGLYLLFLLSVGKPLLSKLYSPYDGPITQPQAVEGEARLDLRAAAPHMAVGFLLSVVIVVLSAGATFGAVGHLAIAGVFLGLTTGGIAASLVPRVRQLRGSYELGNYFILVFCVAMGARTDFSDLLSAGSSIFVFTVVVMFGAITLHFVLAKLARIDVDTLIITSTAAVYGPAFVAPIAEAIDNRQVILAGLTAGLMGYAVGNYMGLGLAYLVG